MAEKITYYSLTLPGRDHPTGLARRRQHGSGFEDEALGKDMEWHFSPVIVEWKRGDSVEELSEISEEEAGRLIEDFRERWKNL